MKNIKKINRFKLFSRNQVFFEYKLNQGYTKAIMSYKSFLYPENKNERIEEVLIFYGNKKIDVYEQRMMRNLKGEEKRIYPDKKTFKTKRELKKYLRESRMRLEKNTKSKLTDIIENWDNPILQRNIFLS